LIFFEYINNQSAADQGQPPYSALLNLVA